MPPRSTHAPSSLPHDGFVRLPQILAILPIGRTTWWKGIKAGRFPAPSKALGAHISVWRVEDIRALLTSLSTHDTDAAA